MDHAADCNSVYAVSIPTPASNASLWKAPRAPFGRSISVDRRAGLAHDASFVGVQWGAFWCSWRAGRRGAPPLAWVVNAARRSAWGGGGRPPGGPRWAPPP